MPSPPPRCLGVEQLSGGIETGALAGGEWGLQVSVLCHGRCVQNIYILMRGNITSSSCQHDTRAGYGGTYSIYIQCCWQCPRCHLWPFSKVDMRAATAERVDSSAFICHCCTASGDRCILGLRLRDAWCGWPCCMGRFGHTTLRTVASCPLLLSRHASL